MTRLISSLVLCLLLSSCATTYSLIGYERVGIVEAEIWRNNKTRKCERRVYMTVMYVTEVECPNANSTRVTKDVRGYAFPPIERKTTIGAEGGSNTR